MKRFSDGGSVPSISVPLLIAFFFYSLLSVSTGSPILGSDEYAYFISGRYFDKLAELYQLDHGLQGISNLLYLPVLFECREIPCRCCIRDMQQLFYFVVRDFVFRVQQF